VEHRPLDGVRAASSSSRRQTRSCPRSGRGRDLISLRRLDDDESFQANTLQYMQIASRSGAGRAGRDDGSIALAVELANSWDPDTYFSDPGLRQGLDDLRGLLRRHDDPRASSIRQRDLDDAHVLRANLRRAFEARDERRAVDALNYVIKESNASPQLERTRERWEYAFHSSDSDPVSELAMKAGLALLDVIRTMGWERLGLCSAPPCLSVYVDLSKNRSRKYCSQNCADRMNQAAYRRRQRWSEISTPVLVAIAGRRRALEVIPGSLDEAAASGSR
jgi:predicted RNA-binding Zn ribbon-like protein